MNKNAQELGKLGGEATKNKHSKEYYAQINKMRKSFKGGRPRKIKSAII